MTVSLRVGGRLDLTAVTTCDLVTARCGAIKRWLQARGPRGRCSIVHDTGITPRDHVGPRPRCRRCAAGRVRNRLNAVAPRGLPWPTRPAARCRDLAELSRSRELLNTVPVALCEPRADAAPRRRRGARVAGERARGTAFALCSEHFVGKRSERALCRVKARRLRCCHRRASLAEHRVEETDRRRTRVQ